MSREENFENVTNVTKDPDNVFEYIDKAYAAGKEDIFIRKLRDNICFDMDSRLRKITKDINRNNENVPYERLVNSLESHILYLEEELRKKDCLIEKLIDNNTNFVSKSFMKCNSSDFQPLEKSSKVGFNFDQNKHFENTRQNKRNALSNLDVDNGNTKSPIKVTNGGLIDFNFDDESVKEKSVNNESEKKDQKIEKRQSVFICGDSLLNGIDGDGVSTKNFCTVVKSFGGSTSRDMVDHIKPAARKKPDKIIVHVGTNDISKKIENTTENLDFVVKTVKDLSPDTQIFFSEICVRNDIMGSFSKVKQKNEELKKFCQERNIGIVEHGNVDHSCLARKQLHMNQKGLKRMALNFKDFFGKI